MRTAPEAIMSELAISFPRWRWWTTVTRLEAPLSGFNGSGRPVGLSLHHSRARTTTSFLDDSRQRTIRCAWKRYTLPLIHALPMSLRRSRSA